MSVVSVEQSFVRFVYPFVFSSENFQVVAAQTNAARLKTDDRKSLEFWQPAAFHKDDLLRYVANYLNPRDDEKTPPTVKVWTLSSHAFNSFSGLGSRAEWFLQATLTDFDLNKINLKIPFAFESVELSLFRVGVGFLTLEVKPLSNELDEWRNFTHFFRYSSRKSVTLAAQRMTGREQTPVDFFPPFAGECDEDGCRRLEAVVCGLLRQTKIGDAEKWWDEVFIPSQMLPYTVLFVENQPPAKDLQMLYNLRKNFHTAQGRNPAASDLDAAHPACLTYAERQWQVFTLDGSAFLACDAPKNQFFRDTFPQHLRDRYFLLFLLALQQRFALTNFSERISENWLEKNEEKRAAAFERIREDFFNFTAHGYFVQAMQREHHHRAYLKWQESFQVERFYSEVRDKIREMHEYLQTRRAERIENYIRQHERKIALIGILLAATFGLPSLVIGFLNINLNRITVEKDGVDFWQAALYVGGALLLGLIIGLITFLIYKKERGVTKIN